MKGKALLLAAIAVFLAYGLPSFQAARLSSRPEAWQPSRPVAQFCPGVSFCTQQSRGVVHILEVSRASALDVWVGERLPRKYRRAKCLGEIVREQNALAGITASFYWTDRRANPFDKLRAGFIVLGQIARDGRSIVSPNPDVLRFHRCYFAVRWHGRFLIGETNLTTGKLLRRHCHLRHVIGGGGWLVRHGDAEAWRLAERQGFKPDVTRSARPRVAVGVSRNGRTAWLVTFDGNVRLCDCAALLHRLGAWDALFFDGGHSAAMEVLSCRVSRAACPERPCTLNQFGRTLQRKVPVMLLVKPP